MHPGEIWTNSYGPNNTKFWAFDKKLIIFDKALTSFWKTIM